jgi:hypothetical protein
MAQTPIRSPIFVYGQEGKMVLLLGLHGELDIPVQATQVVVFDCLTLGDGTDTLSRNLCKGLPLDAALYPRRAQTSKNMNL